MSMEMAVTSNLLMSVSCRLYRPEDGDYQPIQGLLEKAREFTFVEKLSGGMSISFMVKNWTETSFPVDRYYDVLLDLESSGFTWSYNIRGCWVTFKDQMFHAQQHGTNHEWRLKRPNGDVLRLH